MDFIIGPNVFAIIMTLQKRTEYSRVSRQGSKAQRGRLLIAKTGCTRRRAEY
jgi:hypothetical protein